MAEDSGVPCTRQTLLKTALIASGAVGAGRLLAAVDTADAATRPSRAQDVRILNFLLLLEYVQDGFYSLAAAKGALDGELEQIAKVVGAQEKAHAAALARHLGPAARKRPRLRFGGAVADRKRFGRAARDLEEATVAAYIGQGANLTPRAIRVVAPIVSVEARHAAWIRDATRELPAPHAADRAEAPANVLQSLRRRGIVVHG